MPPGYKRKRRSKLEVCLDILGVIAKGESKPTRIMSATNMSWKQLHVEFDKLIERELIMVVDVTSEARRRKSDKRSKLEYRLTQKGENVLKYMRRTASEVESLMAEIHVSKGF